MYTGSNTPFVTSEGSSMNSTNTNSSNTDSASMQGEVSSVHSTNTEVILIVNNFVAMLCTFIVTYLKLGSFFIPHYKVQTFQRKILK
jgi:glutathione peroxidase-family protein